MSSALLRPMASCLRSSNMAGRQRLGSSIARSLRSPRSHKVNKLLLAPGFVLGSLLVTVNCEAAPASSRSYARQGPVETAEPESIINVYQLGFGSVAGICVGVFIKKGLRAIAFLLGGVFVLLQYFASRSLVNVDWHKISSRYESAVDAAAGSRKGAETRASAIWHRFTDFLLADFPPRGVFLAGLALGLSIEGSIVPGLWYLRRLWHYVGLKEVAEVSEFVPVIFVSRLMHFYLKQPFMLAISDLLNRS